MRRRSRRRRRRRYAGKLKGALRGTPAEQFCTQKRTPRPKRGTPVVIIRGPSECFWPRRGSLKFRRHDLEKRSGGSPVIVFHHRRPPAPSPSLPSPPPASASSYTGGGTDAGTSIFQCPVRRMLFSLSLLLLEPSSVGFPRSWLCHLVPDGRVPSSSPPCFE